MIKARLAGLSGFSVGSLFRESQAGLWYDPSDFSTLFQDTAGTVPLTATTQPVRLMRDKSGRSNHVTFSGTNPPLLQVGSTGAYCLQPIDSTSRGVCTTLSIAQPIATCFATDFDFSRNSILYDSYNNNGGLYFQQKATNLGQAGSQANVNLKAIPADPCLVTVIHNGASTEIRVDQYSLGLANGDTNGFSGLSLFNITGNPTPFASPFFSLIPFYGMVIRQGTLTAGQIFNLEAYTKNKAILPLTPAATGFMVGDSVTAAYIGQNAVLDYVTTAKTKNTLSVPGQNTAQQQVVWDQAKFKHTGAWVIIQIGLNDLAPAEAASVAIARIQALVAEVRSYMPPTGKLLISKMTPCRQRLINLYGATDGPISYQKWLDMNTAITGGGGTPITGVDARVTAHEPLMNDGSGNLLGTYDTGDGIHPNNAGRIVNAQAFTNALNALGVL